MPHKKDEQLSKITNAITEIIKNIGADLQDKALKDTPKKTANKILEKIYNEIIQDKNIVHAIGYANIFEIEKLNILHAALLAMERAIENLTIIPDTILIDGNQTISKFKDKSITIINGDNKSLSIAAASIIAKCTRDDYMRRIHKEFPMYYWDKNAGYGTKQHINAIENAGITKYHRQTFAPISTMIKHKKILLPCE